MSAETISAARGLRRADRFVSPACSHARGSHWASCHYGSTQTMNDDALGQMFGQYGRVMEVKVIYDRASNQSKGYGFVTMENVHQASAAIGALNGCGFRNPRAFSERNARSRGDPRGVQG
eukprot:5668980-Pyramimonas_sp.AAC.1